jgi:hypothetical protein
MSPAPRKPLTRTAQLRRPHGALPATTISLTPGTDTIDSGWKPLGRPGVVASAGFFSVTAAAVLGDE